MASSIVSATAKSAKNRRSTKSSPFSKSVPWSDAAPASVVQAEDWGPESRGWTAWVDYLKRRSTSPTAAILNGASSNGMVAARLASPLLWGTTEDTSTNSSSIAGGIDPDTRKLVADLATWSKAGSSVRKAILEELPSWLAESGELPYHASLALECLAIGHALPTFAIHLPADIWWSLLEQLIRFAERTDKRIPSNRDPWTQQLFGTELRLTLAAQFPEIETCRELMEDAATAIFQVLTQTREGVGLLPCEQLAALRPLLACWTRCRGLFPGEPGPSNGHVDWRAEADPLLRNVLRQALRLSRRDGSPVFSKIPWATDDAPLFKRAAELFGGDEERRLVQALYYPRPTTRGKIRPFTESVLPAFHSEKYETSILRTSWGADRQQLTITFGQRRLMCELETSRGLICSGEWKTELRVAGNLLSPTTDWEEVCWVSDEDCDYLELQQTFEGDICLQRQILLARKDHFLFVADALLGQTPSTIEHRFTLPLAGGVTFQGANETREGFLTPAPKSGASSGSRPQALVLPLALSEWRIDRRGGSLETGAEGLTLSQATAAGRRMFVPLFLDLDTRRMTKPVTWRQLTVAENREVQPMDEVVGYRVEIGKGQWLIYRSLGPRGNRTVLGHNLVTEMLVARFGRDGEVDTILEIE